MSASTMRNFAQSLLPEDQATPLLTTLDKIDEQLQEIRYAHMMHVYMEGRKLIPDAPATFSFRSPFDEYPDERAPVNVGIAQLLLRSGVKTESGIIAYDEKNAHIRAKTPPLAAEIISLFAPDFRIAAPQARFDETQERIVRYLQTREPVAQYETLQAAMDRVLGPQEDKYFKRSPFLPDDPDGAIKAYFRRQWGEAADATTALFVDMMTHDPEGRERVRALLARRDALIEKDPAAAPIMSDGLAKRLVEALRPKPQTQSSRPEEPAA